MATKKKQGRHTPESVAKAFRLFIETMETETRDVLTLKEWAEALDLVMADVQMFREGVGEDADE